MNIFRYLIAVCAICFVSAAGAQVQPKATEMSCSDFKPTPEAAERFAVLRGACESIVEINGHTYAKFVAIVRSASSRGVTLNLKATDRTFTAKPGKDLRVLVGKEKVRPGDLERGDEVTIYLSTDQFAQPAITEVDFVQEGTDTIAPVPVESLPTTASLLPAFVLAGAISVILGALMLGFARRRA